MRVTIFGSGYVGLVTGACLADAGNDVLCVDVDAKKIEGLKQGIIPIHEPGLDALIKANIDTADRMATSACWWRASIRTAASTRLSGLRVR